MWDCTWLLICGHCCPVFWVRVSCASAVCAFSLRVVQFIHEYSALVPQNTIFFARFSPQYTKIINRTTLPSVLQNLRSCDSAKLSHCFVKQDTMKGYRGVEVGLHTFLTSAVDGRACLSSQPGHSTPRYSLNKRLWNTGSVWRQGESLACAKNRTQVARSSSL